MLDYAEPVTKLIDEFKRLPSIGQKSAQRLAFHILRAPEAEVERLIAALHEVKEKITQCSTCNNLTDINPCHFCASPSRGTSRKCSPMDRSSMLRPFWFTPCGGNKRATPKPPDMRCYPLTKARRRSRICMT